MYASRLFNIVSSTAAAALLLAGCGAEQSISMHQQSAAVPTTAVAMASAVDPAIPALTIVAHRMSVAEKLAYDRATSPRIAAIQSE